MFLSGGGGLRDSTVVSVLLRYGGTLTRFTKRDITYCKCMTYILFSGSLLCQLWINSAYYNRGTRQVVMRTHSVLQSRSIVSRGRERKGAGQDTGSPKVRHSWKNHCSMFPF